QFLYSLAGVTFNGEMLDRGHGGRHFCTQQALIQVDERLAFERSGDCGKPTDLRRNDQIDATHAQGDFAPRAVHGKAAHAATTSAVPPLVAEAEPLLFV